MIEAEFLSDKYRHHDTREELESQIQHSHSIEYYDLEQSGSITDSQSGDDDEVWCHGDAGFGILVPPFPFLGVRINEKTRNN
jgi:hypothetical protein